MTLTALIVLGCWLAPAAALAAAIVVSATRHKRTVRAEAHRLVDELEEFLAHPSQQGRP